MRNSAGQRGPSLVATVSLVLLSVAALGGLALFSLWMLEYPPFAKRETPPSQGGEPIPVSGQAVQAYTRLKVDHFRNPKTGEPTVRYFSAEEKKRLKEERGVIVNEGELINRVLAHDIPPGALFRESDLEPKGTVAGPSAGLDVGKILFVLPAEKIQGIHSLKQRDHFDLLASVPVDAKGQAKLMAPGSAESLLVQGSSKQATVRVLVKGGTVVIPVSIREVPTGSAATGKGGKIPTKPVQEVHISIDPKEAAPLQEALAIGANLVCVARSSRPDESKAKTVTPGSAPPPPIHAMETIKGNSRQTLYFPTPGKGPEETPSPGPDSIAEPSKK